MGPKLLKLVVAIATLTVPVLAFAAPAHADAPSTMVGLVNTLRGTLGVAPLAIDPTLTSVAQTWANQMASTGVLAHNPNLATQAPTGWSKIAENTGDGYSVTAVYNVLLLMSARSNMVDPTFNRTGVGVATDSKGQVWVDEDFGDYPPPQPATFVFPTTGTVMFPSAQSFSWNQVPGAVYYCVTVGTTQGGADLVNSGQLPGSQLSYTVPALPGGETLWARIYAYDQGAWTWTDSSFTVTGPSTAKFTQPTQGAVNVVTTTPFTWAPVASAVYYGFTVGTIEGAANLVSSTVLPSTQTSYTLPALPAGTVLWARVSSYIDGSWNHYNDVSFTTAPAKSAKS
jgi:hypothetical protein